MHIRETGWASRLFDVFNILLMLGVIFVTVFPFYWMTIVSFSDGNAVIRGDVGLWPVKPTLESYRLIFTDPAIPRSLMNSVLYTTLGTFISLSMTALCAYPLSRTRFCGKGVFTAIIAFTMFFSGGLIPLYLQVVRLGIRDTMWALILPFAINVWYMFIMRTAFKDIHEEIYDAAIVDGANELQIFLRIALPLAKPILATMLLFYAVEYWNDYFNALIFLDDRAKWPIQIILRNIVLLGRFEMQGELAGTSAFLAVEQTLRYATIMVSTLPILVVYPFVQRYFVKGAMIGAIKE